MSAYTRNRHCPCARCRTHGLIGAALLITVGILMLLDQNGIVSVEQSWPVVLLVVGAFIFMSRSASTENHIEPYVAPAPAYVAPAQTWPATVPPPPPPPAAPPQNESEMKP